MGNTPSSPPRSPLVNDEGRTPVYLPDEILIEILSYIPHESESQPDLNSFCRVSRQWYGVGIARLYAEPYLVGGAYTLFVQTICPSINTHIRKSELASLVRKLDLSGIVHQSSKSVTARLLGRTKASLEYFVAPQASFAINCWAALSKCTRLRHLDLSLVSESISFQAFNQTIRSLPELTKLFLPRCSSTYNGNQLSMNIRWPPKLADLHLSGGIHTFMTELNRVPSNFPPTLRDLSISHAPKVTSSDLLSLLGNLAPQLMDLTITNLPQLREGSLDSVLNLCPNLVFLTISMDYLTYALGHMPTSFNPSMWQQGLPLLRLTLLTSGHHHRDSEFYLTPVDLWGMVDTRYLGRLRFVGVAESTGWDEGEWGNELMGLWDALKQLDRENFENERWHFSDGSGRSSGLTYEQYERSPDGRPHVPSIGIIAM
ncbi:hypothetical protein K432DRAFT_356986 [Lepidopterella palustris CBS 459.81]|uniref:F-box domain-containing protein n=1 Tax=Lepidopterella palustris CBS 459.81 TaxID=1314670 RepID=A0A8E2JDB8_9PEZI|nr:hypothetical protein K432DRAFT_356986 [Lepidopterella palustris CBS 459.81]